MTSEKPRYEVVPTLFIFFINDLWQIFIKLLQVGTRGVIEAVDVLWFDAVTGHALLEIDGILQSIWQIMRCLADFAFFVNVGVAAVVSHTNDD